MKDHTHLFTLRVSPYKDEPMIVIEAFINWQKVKLYPSHERVDVQVKQGGKVIFPRGFLYCGIPSHASVDGNYAKEAVLSLVAMRLGDTDEDYFKGYSPEQLEWAARYGEELGMIREQRYCDMNGNVRKG